MKPCSAKSSRAASRMCSAFNSTLCARRHISGRTFGITPKGSSDVRRVIRRALRSPATLSPTTPHWTSRQISSGQLPSTAWQRQSASKFSGATFVRCTCGAETVSSVDTRANNRRSCGPHIHRAVCGHLKDAALRSSASITKRHSSSARGRSSSGLPPSVPAARSRQHFTIFTAAIGLIGFFVYVTRPLANTTVGVIALATDSARVDTPSPSRLA